MSTINLQGATSGTIALVPTAIAGSNTITLPAETGTLRTTVSTGTVLQVVNYQTGAVATGTTTIPTDNTVPQNTEGNEYMTLAITPKSATSTLIITVQVNVALNANVSCCAALFQDSTASAVAANCITPTNSGYLQVIPLAFKMTSGTTSSTTFKVRAGPNTAATLTFNGNGGTSIFGNVVQYSSITITEVVP